jgi:Family of unknown function (DUF5984)
VPVWTAQTGQVDFEVAHFEAELRGLVERILRHMSDRLDDIERRRSEPQCSVDIEALRSQHDLWSAEFASRLSPRAPDYPWDKTLEALRGLSERYDLQLTL